MIFNLSELSTEYLLAELSTGFNLAELDDFYLPMIYWITSNLSELSTK